MSGFDYNDRIFIGIQNYDDGDMTTETVFKYHQKGHTVWGTFEGGNVVYGSMVARMLDDGRLDMVWQYLNKSGTLHTGTCMSTPEVLPDGRYRLHEEWTETSGEGRKGTSVVEEVR